MLPLTSRSSSGRHWLWCDLEFERGLSANALDFTPLTSMLDAVLPHGIRRMKVHQIKGYIQSIYLVEYDDRLLLLDGCCRADIAILENFITQQLNRPMNHLKAVLVTHMHPDHAGAAGLLRKKYDVLVLSASKSTHWYQGWQGVLMHWTDILLAQWVAKRIGRPRKNIWYERKLVPDIRMKDGDFIPEFEEWQVFETPGHTDRDLSVMHVPSRKIYVADLIVKVKKNFIAPFPVFHPNQYRQSLRRLVELSPSSIWLAHGGEVQLSASQYQFLQSSAPSNPQTHWRATKGKIKRVMKLGKRPN